MRRALPLLAANLLISGLTPVFALLAVREWPPMTLGWLRFGTAGLLLWATARRRGQRMPLRRDTWWRLLGIAAICVPLNQFCFLYGVRFANASHAGIFYALNPVLIFWGALLLGQTRFRWSLFVATLLAVTGAGLVARSSQGPDGFRLDGGMLRGDLLLFGAILSWSLFSLVSRSMVRREGPLVTLAAVFCLGAVLHTPLALLDIAQLDLAAITWRGWLGAGFVTLITSYVNYLLWYLVIQRHDLTRASVVLNASFVITVLTGWLWLGETPQALFVYGCLLTLAGIALVVYDQLGGKVLKLSEAKRTT